MLFTRPLFARAAWKGMSLVHSCPKDSCHPSLNANQLSLNPKGPYFTAFPGIAEAVKTHTPIRTSARACTILPNFIGLVTSLLLLSPLAPFFFRNL